MELASELSQIIINPYQLGDSQYCFHKSLCLWSYILAENIMKQRTTMTCKMFHPSPSNFNVEYII